MQSVVVPDEPESTPSNPHFEQTYSRLPVVRRMAFAASSMFQSSSSGLARSHRPWFLPERAQLLVLRRQFPLSD